ncbi:sideroflexin-2-like [Amphiura filiformis]|uniref:sideroflexin-2-like n=1 Tax=Amphiura filiformis TaxID=82378 RepID=UPI003B20D299
MTASATTSTAASIPLRVDLTTPRWNQSTFTGRFQHFFNICDPRLSVYKNESFENARDLVTKYKLGIEPPGTKQEQLWLAQKLYMSSYHPDSGEEQNRIGRMSFQVPMCMVIASASLQFYRSLPAVIFWQWVNQSFNAIVNYTNRNATSPITNRQIGIAYVSATTGGFLAAFTFSNITKRSLPIIRRYVPFVAVSSAHMVNVPVTRQQEILHGVKVYTKQGEELGASKKAAYKGISQVVATRIFTVTPSLGGIPIIMEALLRYKWFQHATWSHIPLQATLVGIMMTVMVPFGCALFPQRASIATENLEPELRNHIREKYGDSIDRVYFNKGL